MTTILTMSSYFKGEALIEAAKKEGARVILLTVESLKDDPWPRASVDEFFLMPSLSNLPDTLYAVAYLARNEEIARIIPLDEYDVEMAAILREHLRMPGMGMTATKHFRDKLAMRQVAQDGGILVPDFSAVVNHKKIAEFMNRVPGPWVLKPRLEAGAMGIKRVANSDELWHLLNVLGDQQSFRVLERYVPGDVYHVDSLTYKGKTIFTSVQKYGAPPLNVAHDGGIFTTLTLDPKSDEVKELEKLNAKVISTLGLTDGPTHAEFIKGREDGKFYFLEIAARVGGAHISDLVEMATGINLWAEWARMEIAAAEGREYKLPKVSRRFAGLLVSLAKYEYPDLSAYNDSEVVWRLNKKNHAGLIVAADNGERVTDLVNHYRDRFVHDFLAVAPPRESATN